MDPKSIEHLRAASAYPVLESEFDNDRGEHVYVQTGGVSMRDYFAAKAMQGFCANSAHAVLDGEHEFETAAKEAYFMADVMLRARGQS